MAFFPLPFTTTIERGVVVIQPSGQSYVDSFTVVSTGTKCLFLTTSGNKRTVMREDFEAVMAFYLEPTADVEEGDIVTNIKDKKGTVVEAGRFEVLSVKKVAGLSGSIHHLSLKLKGLA